MESEGKKMRDKGGIWTLEGKKRREQEIQSAAVKSVICLLCESGQSPVRTGGTELLNF